MTSIDNDQEDFNPFTKCRTYFVSSVLFAHHSQMHIQYYTGFDKKNL